MATILSFLKTAPLRSDINYINSASIRQFLFSIKKLPGNLELTLHWMSIFEIIRSLWKAYHINTVTTTLKWSLYMKALAIQSIGL